MAEDELAHLAAEAQQQGVAEVLQLLQQPEHLDRLPELLREYESKLSATQAGLSGMVQSQVEAARRGLELADRSHKHVMRLRTDLDKTHQLCEECARLLDHQDTMRLLSLAHSNVNKVLAELRGIVDLPSHAEAALAMLHDPMQLYPAFQVLTVLEGTAENAKLAWAKNARAVRADMGGLLLYLDRVGGAMAQLQDVLWGHLQEYEVLAQTCPSLLVTCLRVVELQEQVDKQYLRSKLDGVQPKAFKQRLMRMVAELVEARFARLEELAPACGQPNRQVKYTQEGDIVVEEKRDYLGTLMALQLLDATTGKQEEVTDPGVLATIEIITEEVFDEGQFLDEIMPELYAVEAALADAFDHVAPCFPPAYHIFDTLLQLYQLHVSVVVDTVGQRAQHLTTRGSLRIMEFIHKYTDTLRGFGVDEALIKLPPPPTTNPDLPPGLDNLMKCYIERMELNVTRWFNNILVADLQYPPTPGPNGKLCTAGITDFFRILNEEMEVVRGIDDHGEVMYKSALMALRIMTAFQEAQTRAIADPDSHLSLEMYCALLNNNMTCYDQSLTFVEEVQGQLEEHYRAGLQVEEVCRGFLDTAKVAAKRVVGCVFNDPGMSIQLKALFSTEEWAGGATMATLLATLGDYMQDLKRWVEDTFVRRVAEIVLEQLVWRITNIFTAGIPQVTDAFAARVVADQAAIQTYFEQLLKPDKLARGMQQLGYIRAIVCAPSVAAVTEAYCGLLSVHAGFTPELFDRTMDAREGHLGWERKTQIKQAKAAAKEAYAKHKAVLDAASKAAAEAQAQAKAQDTKRWFGLFG